MCYSANASAVAYCIGILSSFAMFRIGHPVIATLIGTYSGMQLAEAVVWHSIDTDNRPLNQVGSRMILWNLSIHALMTVTSAIYFCMWCAHGGKWSSSDKTILFVLWAVSFMLMMVTISTTRTGAETYPGCARTAAGTGTVTETGTETGTESGDVAQSSEHQSMMSMVPQSLRQPFACRLRWDTTSVSNTAASGLYAAQVLLILLVLSLVYHRQPNVTFVCFGFFMILLLGLGVIAWMHHRKDQPKDRSRALAMAMSTMWCFGTAVLSPVLVGLVWCVSL